MYEQIKLLEDYLLSLYSKEGPERCGFLLENGMFEVPNVSSDPIAGFEISPRDVIEFTEEKGAVATWHTHPDRSSNLSGEDYHMFMRWPNLYHVIIGNNGFKVYKYDTAKKAIMESK